jgi:hypothetical protein
MIGTNEKEIESLRQIKWWREYQARQMLSLWKQSGMSLRGFCRRYAIGYKRLLRWKRLLEAQPVSVGFVRVDLPRQRIKDQTDQMEILLGNGRIIRIRPGFDSESLHQALMVVEAS